MRIRQSDLSAYSRCPQQKYLKGQAELGLAPEPAALSATEYGTVMHYATQVLETLHQAGEADALERAVATFNYYWNPEHIEELPGARRITEWIARQTWTTFSSAGPRVLREYYTQLLGDTGELLALEVHFEVPITLLDGSEHTLVGTMDRLSLRKIQGRHYLNIEDFKSGKKPTFLRHNVQFTVYSYATTQPEFWLPWGEQAAARDEKYALMGRRGTWISLRDVTRSDAGWRGERDYDRLRVALAEYVKAEEAGAHPLNLAGEVCQYCPFRDVCGGVAVPPDDYGRPTKENA